MFSNDNELKKYFYLISYAGIILAIILNLSSVFSFIQYLWQLIIPFIVGFCIAFILNIITNQLEKSLLKNVRNRRMISFILTLILFVSFLLLICFIGIPPIGIVMVFTYRDNLRMVELAYSLSFIVKFLFFIKKPQILHCGDIVHKSFL